jgi:hypothetical protein
MAQAQTIYNNTCCKFCKSFSHNSFNCIIENKMAPHFKKAVGLKIEDFITENLSCKECNTKNLYKLGDDTPSLDIICKNCDAMYEVKSKCLSIKNIRAYLMKIQKYLLQLKCISIKHLLLKFWY